MCFISPLQAELGRGYPRGAEARAVAVLSRGCPTRPTRHQAEPEMLARAERPRPGPRPPPVSLFPPPSSLLLLLLAMLSAPVCGRVPRSVPRTSLPISGKMQEPLSSALCTVPCPCQQVPTPTCPANSSDSHLRPLCTVHTPVGPKLRLLPCIFLSHLIPPHLTPSHLPLGLFHRLAPLSLPLVPSCCHLRTFVKSLHDPCDAFPSLSLWDP